MWRLKLQGHLPLPSGKLRPTCVITRLKNNLKLTTSLVADYQELKKKLFYIFLTFTKKQNSYFYSATLY